MFVETNTLIFMQLRVSLNTFSYSMRDLNENQMRRHKKRACSIARWKNDHVVAKMWGKK